MMSNLNALIIGIEQLKNQEGLTQELFEQKLKELREYQDRVVEKKNKVYKLFPDEIFKWLHKEEIVIDYNGTKYVVLCIKNHHIVIGVNTSYEGTIIQKDNYFSEILDWWADKPHRKSHLLARKELLEREEAACNAITENIDYIYKIMAEKLTEYMNRDGMNNTKLLNELDIKPNLNKDIKNMTVEVQIIIRNE